MLVNFDELVLLAWMAAEKVSRLCSKFSLVSGSESVRRLSYVIVRRERSSLVRISLKMGNLFDDEKGDAFFAKLQLKCVDFQTD